MKFRPALISSCLILLQQAAFAGSSDGDSCRNRLSVLPVPAFGYAPETKAYVGVVCLFSKNLGKDSLTRASNAKVELNYTQRKQFIMEIGWNLFAPEEKWFSFGKLHGSRFPDFYWGTGNNTPESSKRGFNSNRLIGETYLLRNIGNSWFVGPSLRYVQYQNLSIDTGQQPNMEGIPPLRAFGASFLTLLKDTRNNILLPSSGKYFFYQPILMFRPGKSYIRMVIDVRRYFTIGKKATWSGRLKTLISTSGHALDMASFGGDDNVRGFYAGRYRDMGYCTLQQELRYTVYRRWGFAAFGGISAINKMGGIWDSNAFKYNAGGGLRFLVDRKQHINMRIDYALGSGGQKGFYVAFGEAF